MALSNIIETREWDIESTMLLINLFKENECLYKNTHIDYANKDIRRDIICKIAKEIDEKTGKECSVADVRKELSSLWSQYLAEKQKIITSNNNSEEYTSAKYWFPLLSFLDSHASPDLSQSNLESDVPNEPTFLFVPQKNIEQEPPKPPRRRKKSQIDNISMSNFNVTQPVSNVPSNLTADMHPHITTFCSFMKSELVCIKEAGGEEFLKKAKRKLQLALFEVWDEMESLNDDLE